MAAYRSSQGNFNTSSGTKVTTIISSSNIDGDLPIVIVANTGQTSTPTLTDDHPDGLGQYTQICTALKNSSADRASIWVRQSRYVGSTGSDVSFTMTPGATSGGGLIVVLVSGMQRADLSAIRQNAVQENQAAGGTPAPVFGAAMLTGNMGIGFIFNATTSATTPPTSWTTRSNSSYTSPTTGGHPVTRNSGETNSTITWGGTSATAFSSLVIELDDSAPPSGGPPAVRAQYPQLLAH